MTTFKKKRLTVAAAAIVVSSILASCGDSSGGTGSDYNSGVNQPLNNPTQASSSINSNTYSSSSQNQDQASNPSTDTPSDNSNNVYSPAPDINNKTPSGVANIASDSDPKAITSPDPIKKIGAVNRFTTFDPSNTNSASNDSTSTDNIHSSNGQNTADKKYGSGVYHLGSVQFPGAKHEQPAGPRYVDPTQDGVHTTTGGRDHEKLDLNPNTPFSENSYFGKSCLHGDYYLSVLTGKCESASDSTVIRDYDKRIVPNTSSNFERQNRFYTFSFPEYQGYNAYLAYNLNSGIHPFDARSNGEVSFAEQEHFISHFTVIEEGRYPVNLQFLIGAGFFQPFSGLGIPTSVAYNNGYNNHNGTDLVNPGLAHNLYGEYLEHKSSLKTYFVNDNNNLKMPFTGEGYRVAFIDGNTDFEKLSKFYNKKPIMIDLSELNQGQYGVEQSHPFSTSAIIGSHRSRTGVGIVPDVQLYAARLTFFDPKTATAEQKLIEQNEFKNIDKLFIKTYEVAKPVVINNSFGYSFANPLNEADKKFFRESAITYSNGFRYLANQKENAPLLVFSSGNYNLSSFTNYVKGQIRFDSLTDQQKLDYYDWFSGVTETGENNSLTSFSSNSAIQIREKRISIALQSSSFLGNIINDPLAIQNLIVVTGGYYNYGTDTIRNYDDSQRISFLNNLIKGIKDADKSSRVAKIKSHNTSKDQDSNLAISDNKETAIATSIETPKDGNKDPDQQKDLKQLNSSSNTEEEVVDSKSQDKPASQPSSPDDKLESIAKNISDNIHTAGTSTLDFSSSEKQTTEKFHKIEQPGHRYYSRPFVSRPALFGSQVPQAALASNPQAVAQETLKVLASPNNPLSGMRTTAENIELMNHGVVDTSSPEKDSKTLSHSSIPTVKTQLTGGGKTIPAPVLAGSSEPITPVKSIEEDKELEIKYTNLNNLSYDENGRYIQAFGAFACGVTEYHCITAPFMVQVPSINKQGKFNSELIWGTSFSAPIVSGAAVMIKQQFPWFTAKNIKTTLLTTAFDAGDKGIDPLFGWGFLNVAGALRGPGMFAFGDFVANLSNRALAPTDQNTHYASFFTNNIYGTGGLIVEGNSLQDQLYLTGDNHYQGDTIVDGGTLVLSNPKDLNLISYGFSNNEFARIDSPNTYVNTLGQFIVNDANTRNIYNNGRLSLAKATVYGDLVLSPNSLLTIDQSKFPETSKVTNGILANGELTVQIDSSMSSGGYLATDQVHSNRILVAKTIQGNFKNVKVEAKDSKTTNREAFNLSISDPEVKLTALSEDEKARLNNDTPVYTTYEDTNTISSSNDRLRYNMIQYKPDFKVALDVQYRIANPSSANIDAVLHSSSTDASLLSLVDPTINRLFAKANSLVRTQKVTSGTTDNLGNAPSLAASSNKSSPTNSNLAERTLAQTAPQAPSLQSGQSSQATPSALSASPNLAKDGSKDTPKLSLESATLDSSANSALTLDHPHTLVEANKLIHSSSAAQASSSTSQPKAVVLSSASNPASVQDDPTVKAASIIQHMNDQQLRKFYFANSGSIFADLQLATNAQAMQTSLAFGKVVNGRLIGTQEYQSYVVPQYHAYFNYNYTNIDWHNDDSLIHGKHLGQGITAGVYGYFGNLAYGIAAYHNSADWHENLANDYSNPSDDKSTNLANGSVSTTGLTASYAYSQAAGKFSITGYFNYQSYELTRTSLFSLDQQASFNDIQAGLHADYSYRLYGDSYSGLVLAGGATLDNTHQSEFTETAKLGTQNFGVVATNEQLTSFSKTLSLNAKSRNHLNGFVSLGTSYYNNFRLFGYGHHLELGVNLDKSIFGNNYAIKNTDGNLLTGQVFDNDFLLHGDAKYSIDVNNNINFALKASYDYSSNWSNKQFDISLDFTL